MIDGAGSASGVRAWTEALRSDGAALTGEFADAAAELDELGYGTLWLGGGPPVTYARPLLAGDLPDDGRHRHPQHLAARGRRGRRAARRAGARLPRPVRARASG